MATYSGASMFGKGGITIATARIYVIALIVLMFTAAGCTDPTGGRTAEHTLELAAAGLEGVDRYGFRMKTIVSTGEHNAREIESYEGEITGHAKLRIRNTATGKIMQAADLTAGKRTPAGRLAELQRLDKTVSYASPVKGGTLLLRIELSPHASSRDAAERIRARFERAAEASSAAADEAGKSKAAKSKTDYAEAAAEEIEQSRRELERMLDGLQAETVALLTIDRTTLLPLKLAETTVLRYEAAGRMREEKTVTSVEFDGFNGKPEP